MPNELTPANLAKLAEQLGLPKPQVCEALIVPKHSRVDAVGWYQCKLHGPVQVTRLFPPQHLVTIDLLSDTGFSLMVGAALRMGLVLDFGGIKGPHSCTVSKGDGRATGYGRDPDYRVATALALGEFFDKGGAR